MKSKTQILYLLVLILTAFTASVNAQNITTFEDAYVEGGESADDVMQEEKPNELKVFNSNGSNKYARISYLKFELPKDLDKIKSAKLNMRIKVYNKADDDKEFKLDVHTVSNNNWREDTITWNDKPETGDILGSISLKMTEGDNHSVEEITLDKDKLIALAKAGNTNIISLALKNNENNKTSSSIVSKDKSKKFAVYLAIE